MLERHRTVLLTFFQLVHPVGLQLLCVDVKVCVTTGGLCVSGPTREGSLLAHPAAQYRLPQVRTLHQK